MKLIKRRTIYIETYGCQMNEYDTELLTTILTQHGYEFVTDENLADIYLLNTCSVREHANEKIYHRVFDLQKKHKRRKVLIGILGCMAENLQTKLLEDKRFKIDFVAGPDSYRRLPELLQTLELEGKKGYDIELSEIETYENILPARQEGINAWVAVMRGCNNFCAYCVVPYPRGRERSRSAESILREIEKSAAQGYRQVTLLGQNVNSYSYEGMDFAGLLARGQLRQIACGDFAEIQSEFRGQRGHVPEHVAKLFGQQRLALFGDPHILARIEKRAMGAGIKPCNSPPQKFDM